VNISSAIFDCSAPDLDSCPDESLPEFAFIGRSNVGKSSLLNMLAGEQGLARVSRTPGFTKLINLFTMNKCWRLVDLPGYGFAHAARKDSARFNQTVNDYLENRPNLCLVFALIESGLAPQEIDLEFVEWLARHAVPFVFVFTKTDKVSAVTAQTNIAAFTDRISAWFEKPAGGVHLFGHDSAGPAGVARGNRRGDDGNRHRVNSGAGTYRNLPKPKPGSAHSG
jgi:GTP-binding protein